MSTDNLIAIYESGSPGRLAVAKSLLEAAGISYIVQNELIQDLCGYGRMWTGYNYIFGTVKIRVKPEDANHAQDLLSDMPSSEPPKLRKRLRYLAIVLAAGSALGVIYQLWITLITVIKTIH